jgi:hypothetical protein
VAHAEAPSDRPLRDALPVETVDLSPVLHSEHLFLLGSPDRPEHRSEPGLRSGRASRFQPARGVQFSTGVDRGLFACSRLPSGRRSLYGATPWRTWTHRFDHASGRRAGARARHPVQRRRAFTIQARESNQTPSLLAHTGWSISERAWLAALCRRRVSDRRPRERSRPAGWGRRQDLAAATGRRTGSASPPRNAPGSCTSLCRSRVRG